jgi:hypothetical protein
MNHYPDIQNEKENVLETIPRDPIFRNNLITNQTIYMKIPKSFELMGQTITVEYDKKLQSRCGAN